MNAAPDKSPAADVSGSKTSVLAVLAFAFGILGFTVVGSLVGLALGLVAKFRIKRSGGRLKGNGFAWAGIIVSGVWLLALAVAIVGFALPAFAKMQAGMMNYPGGSGRSLSRIALAARFFQNDNGGRLPPAENWTATLRPLLGARADLTLRRPGNPPGAECGYGYNADVAGLTAAEADPRTVVFFELETPACNAAGGAELLRHPVNERDRVFVVTVDGRVSAIVSTNLTALRWKP